MESTNNNYLPFVKCFKLFAPDFKESGAFVRTHQGPVCVILNTPHEEIWDPQTQEEVPSAMLFGTSVLPHVKKLENVGVPRLQVDGKCSRPLKCQRAHYTHCVSTEVRLKFKSV